MQVLILSPHRDDAAFSCGFLLVGLLQAGHSLCIVNVCSISAYAPYLAHTAQDRTQQVSKVRRKEDDGFAKGLVTAANSTAEPVAWIDLDWKDLPLRWQTDDGASLASGPLDSSEVEALQNSFRSLPPADIILCPKALGGHMDHRLVCRAAQMAFDLSSLVFYEDLPYACGALAKPSLELVDLHTVQEAWISPATLIPGLKRTFCLYYASQIDSAAAESMEHYGQLHQGERFAALPETLNKLCLALVPAGARA